MTVRVLFVCTGNIDRSPTAERLLKDKEGFEVRSAGTWMNARNRISCELINWADMIFAMEEKHRDAVSAVCPEAEEKTIVLNIPDSYRRDDPELVAILEERISQHLRVRW